MVKINVPIKGIDTRASDVFSAVDGSCLYLENMKPFGNPQKPNWKAIGEKSPVPFNLTYNANDTLQVLSSYFYNDVWFIAIRQLVQGVDSDEYFRVYKCALNSGNWEEDTLLLEEVYDDIIDDSNPRITWQEARDQFYLHFVGINDLPLIFRLNYSQDTFIPHVIPPVIYPYVTSVTKEQIVNSIWDRKFINGNYPGILANEDKYVGIIFAVKLRDGYYIKHSQPLILEIPKQASNDTTHVEVAYIKVEEHSGYTNSAANYEDNIALFDDYQFPYSVSGQTITETFDNCSYVNNRSYEVCIFSTRVMSSFEKALVEGSYYLIGSAGSVGVFAVGQYLFKDNEETIVLNEQLNIDPFSHHLITPKYLGEYRNNLSCSQVVTNFALPTWEWVSANHRLLQAETTLLSENYECAVVVQIKAGDRTFYRINRVAMIYSAFVLIPHFLSYPDQRANRITIYWYDASNSMYKSLVSASLIPHPFLNIAYNYDDNRSDVTTPSNGDGDTNLDFSVNEEHLVEEQNVKISDLTHLSYPLERTYQLQDKILGVIDNIDEVGQGQFGDYPIYFLGRKKIFGGKSTGEVFVSKIDLICSTHGVLGPDAFTIYKNGLWFASDYGLHVMYGSKIEDVFRAVEDAAQYDINAPDPDNIISPTYQYNLSLQSGTGITSMLSSQKVMVEASAENDEVLFTQPLGTGVGIWVFNLRYGSWYVYATDTIEAFENSVFLKKIGNQVYFYDALYGYDSSGPSFNQDFLRQWESEESTGDFSLITNPFVFDSYSSFKKWKTSIIQGLFSIPSGGSLDVVLQGLRSTHDDWIDLIYYNETTEKEISKGYYLKSNYGSFQAFRLLINGVGMNATSYIGSILIDYIPRNRNLKK